MSKPIIQQDSPTLQAASLIRPQSGGEYIVSEDVAFEQAGHTLRGVALLDDGAWAARVRHDALGEYLELGFDADDQRIPAHPAWDSAIIREVGTRPASPSPDGDAFPAIGDVPRLVAFPALVACEVAA